jgi:fermentation-respiration switch protein FrsA (DUF1100 family)
MNPTAAPEILQPSSEGTRRKPAPRGWWRVLRRVIISLLLIAAVLLFGALPYWLARVATSASTRPMDRALTQTPASFGAAYRDVQFETADGVKISGWYLPSNGKGVTIVYSHGLFRSRRELLERAMDLCKRGYGALLYDARNHGESGPARVSLGYFERQDAEAAVRYLREVENSKDRVALFGISLGAVTALRAAVETPEVGAVISDSSFLSLEDTTDHHVRLFLRLPPFPIADETRFFIERRAGFDGDRLSALEAVKNLGDRPVLFIAGANDRRMPPGIAQKLFEASASQKSGLLVVEGEATKVHGHAYQADPKLYVVRIDQFLTSALSD